MSVSFTSVNALLIQASVNTLAEFEHVSVVDSVFVGIRRSCAHFCPCYLSSKCIHLHCSASPPTHTTLNLQKEITLQKKPFYIELKFHLHVKLKPLRYRKWDNSIFMQSVAIGLWCHESWVCVEVDAEGGGVQVGVWKSLIQHMGICWIAGTIMHWGAILHRQNTHAHTHSNTLAMPSPITLHVSVPKKPHDSPSGTYS